MEFALIPCEKTTLGNTKIGKLVHKAAIELFGPHLCTSMSRRWMLRCWGNSTFRLSYRAPGGLLGLIADRIAARQVGRVLQQSLANVRAMVGP
jgi:hypothetical protein